MITKENLQNALNMAIDDYSSDEDDITKGEIDDIKTRFNQIINNIKEDASEDK